MGNARVPQSALRAFHLVAEAGGFTKAAQAAGLSQPTLSVQVRALEHAHGIRLFDRRGRQISLTPLGQNLHAITTRLFAAEDDANALLAGARTLARGRLRLAADSATHVMPLLARLKQRHPGRLAVRPAMPQEVVHELDRSVGVSQRAERQADGSADTAHGAEGYAAGL